MASEKRTTNNAGSSSKAEISTQTNTDLQIKMARQYPRDLHRSANNAIAIVTMSDETAAKCIYKVDNDGEVVYRPTYEFAKILAQSFGNIQTDTSIVRTTDTHVVAKGAAWDIENNYFSAFEVERSIEGVAKEEIASIGSSAGSVALRIAILAIIPRSITDQVFNALLQKLGLSQGARTSTHKNSIVPKDKKATLSNKRASKSTPIDPLP